MTAQDLKNSILQQAIQGKLLPQNPDDEPASELLKKNSAERQKLIDEGKIKNPPQLPPISDDEKPFDIPDSWQWVRLGEISNYGINENVSPADMSVGKLLIDLEDIEKIADDLSIKNFSMVITQKVPNMFFAAAMFFTGNCAFILTKLSLSMKTAIALQKFCLWTLEKIFSINTLNIF